MAQSLEVLEERYYDRMFDKYNEPPRRKYDIDYNPKERRYALDNLLEFIEGDIECLTDYAKSVSPEKQQVAREYDGLLAKLREYAEMLRNDRFQANYEYMRDKDYYDSLD